MNQHSISSWPGRGGDLNPFINSLMDSLEDIGLSTTALNDFPFNKIEDCNLVLLHWPQFIYSNSFGKLSKFKTLLTFINQLRGLKKRGIKIVWICHDLHPHDWDTLFWKLLWWPTIRATCFYSDLVLTLSPGTMEVVQKQLGPWLKNKVNWSWHPSYLNVKVSENDRTASRERLHITPNDTVFCFFGQLRKQKGVQALIKAFMKTENPKFKLLIAGPPTANVTEEEIATLTQSDQRIILNLGFQSEDDLKKMVGASDVCVFPYTKYFHSGAMIYSLSAGKCLLTPTTAFSESLKNDFPEWVELYEGELDKTNLENFAKRHQPQKEPDLSALAPENLAKAIASAL